MTKIDENGVEADITHLVGSDVGFTEEQHETRMAAPLSRGKGESPVVPPWIAQILADEFGDRVAFASMPNIGPSEIPHGDSNDAARWIPGEGWQ